MQSGVQEHVIANVKIPKNCFVVADFACVIIADVDSSCSVFAIGRVIFIRNFWELAQIHFVIAVMDLCTKRQILDGVKFNATALCTRFNNDSVGVSLEIANRRVECIEQDLVRRVIRIVET